MSDFSQRIAALSPEQREVLLRQLAKNRQPGPAPAVTLPAIVPRPEDRFEPFPLTDVQQVYWAGRSGFFDLPTPGPGATVYLEYDIPGDESLLPRFEASVRRLCDRHEILRAVMLPDGRQQCLRDLPPWGIERVDLRWLKEDEVEARIAETRERLRYQRGEIGQWPLFGFLANLLAGGRIRLHAWFDAWLIDGLSRDNLVRDLVTVLDDPDADLPPLSVSYRDYAMAWEEIRRTDLYRQSRDYWLERVPRFPPLPDLPLAELPRPDVPVRFDVRIFEILDGGGWTRLKARAARLGLTPTAPLLAAFAEVLRTWSRNPSFTFGLDGTYWPPIHPQLRDIVGNFNTVHLLAADDLPGTFTSRAAALQKQLTDALDHCLFSGFRVLREINRRQGGSQRAQLPILFNSLVEFSHPAHQSRQAAPRPEAPAAAPAAAETGGTDGNGGNGVVQVEIIANLPQMLLTAAVLEGAGGSLQGRLQASVDHFPPGVVDALRDAYLEIVRRLAEDDAAWETHRFQLTAAAVPPTAGPEREIAAGATLHGLIAARAAADPDRQAVASPEGSLTYRELMERSAGLAARLRSLGAGPGQLVAVLLDGGWQQPVGLLGALQSGAACLPLDASTPPDLRRARWVVARAEATARHAVPDGVHRLAIEDGEPALPAVPSSGSGDDIAYVAGSAEIDHRAAVNTVQELGRHLGLGPGDRLLSLTPPASDLALYDVLAPLAAGATVVLPAAGGGSEMLIREAATIWSAPPALLDGIAARLPEDTVPLPPRLIVLGRGTVPLSLPGRLRALAPNARIVASRGFPEAAGVSALHEIGEIPPDAIRLPTGEPIAGHALHVLDTSLEPRPAWVPGDLYVGGAFGPRGDLSPAHPRTGERLVRTGFAARCRPEGGVEILEKERDFKVEIAGTPVEPRRVEAALERHPDVRAAVVRDVPDGQGRRRLAAWIVPARGAAFAADRLASFLRRQLPPALVPAWFEEVAELPLTAAGEVDRDALTLADTGLRDHREKDLARLWAEILGLEAPVGATDNFFELGGDSFTAARLLVRLGEDFGASPDLAAFFEARRSGTTSPGCCTGSRRGGPRTVPPPPWRPP